MKLARVAVDSAPEGLTLHPTGGITLEADDPVEQT